MYLLYVRVPRGTSKKQFLFQIRTELNLKTIKNKTFDERSYLCLEVDSRHRLVALMWDIEDSTDSFMFHVEKAVG